jgi:hypothetical protein
VDDVEKQNLDRKIGKLDYLKGKMSKLKGKMYNLKDFVKAGWMKGN